MGGGTEVGFAGCRRSCDDYGKRWKRMNDHVIILFLSDFRVLDAIKG
jgi:hypothetical protein